MDSLPRILGRVPRDHLNLHGWVSPGEWAPALGQADQRKQRASFYQNTKTKKNEFGQNPNPPQKKRLDGGGGRRSAARSSVAPAGCSVPAAACEPWQPGKATVETGGLPCGRRPEAASAKLSGPAILVAGSAVLVHPPRPALELELGRGPRRRQHREPRPERGGDLRRRW